jgi:hypothetical protein
LVVLDGLDIAVVVALDIIEKILNLKLARCHNLALIPHQLFLYLLIKHNRLVP